MPYLLQSSTARVLASDMLPSEVAAAWLENPPVGEPGSRATRRETAEGVFVIKPDRSGRLRRIVHRLLGRGLRSSRVLHLGRDLDAKETPTARPLAVVERRGSGEAWLVLEHRPGVDLLEFLTVGAGSSAAPHGGRGDRRLLWREVARAVADVHRAGFRQRDLKAPNVLVDWGEGEATPRIVLIDLDGISRRRRLIGRAERERDMGRLAASFGSEAFIRAGVDDHDWRALVASYLELTSSAATEAYEIERWTRVTSELGARKLERNRRKGRSTS